MLLGLPQHVEGRGLVLTTSTQLCCWTWPAVLGAASLPVHCCSHLEVSVLAELAESLVEMCLQQIFTGSSDVRCLGLRPLHVTPYEHVRLD